MAKRLWRKERLGADTIFVYLVDDLKNEDGDVLHGEWDYENDIISINSSDHGHIAASTLIHERIHAISDKFGLGLSEKTIRILERGLVQMERDYTPGEDFQLDRDKT